MTSEEVQIVVSAIVWSIMSTLITQLTSIAVMWWLGVPPRKLAHEIEEVQNPAVGASFFIISLTAAFFIGFFTSDGFTQTANFVSGAFWVIGAFFMGAILSAINFAIAHRVMDRVENESVYGYMRRELIEEQNVSLAFFLGGLSVAPFISTLFQVI